MKKIPVYSMQPDTVINIIQEDPQPDTVRPSINLMDTSLRVKPLPFPEEREVAKPKEKAVQSIQKVEPLETARLKKLQWNEKVDSVYKTELQDLEGGFVDFQSRNTIKHNIDSNFYATETAANVEQKMPLTYKSFTPDWIFGIMLLSSFIIILIRIYYDKYLNIVFKSIHNYQFSFKLFKDQSALYTQLSYILNLNSAIVTGLYFYQLLKYFKTETFLGFSGFSLLLVIPVILIGIYILQYIVFSFIGNLTLRRNAGKEYMHHAFMLNKIMGLVFIPITLCIAYLPDYMRVYFVYLGSVVIVLFYFKRIQRGITILNRNHVLKFYWILYFCTLEILPVLMMVKLIISFI